MAKMVYFSASMRVVLVPLLMAFIRVHLQSYTTMQCLVRQASRRNPHLERGGYKVTCLLYSSAMGLLQTTTCAASRSLDEITGENGESIADFFPVGRCGNDAC